MADNVVEIPNNIIKFPNSQQTIDIPTTNEELEHSKEKIKDMFFDMASIEFAAPIFNRASIHGFDISNDDHIRDCIMVVESIKSLLLKSKGIHHAIQDYAETNINYVEDDFVFGNSQD
jgi:hypothetical protein